MTILPSMFFCAQIERNVWKIYKERSKSGPPRVKQC